MRCAVILLLSVVAVVCAQNIDPSLVARVQQEQLVARKYLDTILKLQHAQYNSQAGSNFVQLLMLEYSEKKSSDAISMIEEDADFEEDDANTLFGENTNDGWGYDIETNKKQVSADLLGSYNLYYANKIKFLQTIYQAADIQREFWADRALQLQIQALAGQLPPQLLQLLYFKMYRTQLSTLKLSLTLQMISHYTMWLEDAIDVNTALLDSKNAHSSIVAEDQADDLINDKLYAFTAFNSYAMTDFQIFYIDLYLEAAAAQAAVGAAAPAAPAAPAAGAAPAADASATSFLEEGAEPNSFFPFLGAAAAGGINPTAYFKYYKMMYLLLQLNSARSALTSVQAENLAFEKENDNDASNDKEAAQYRKFAQQMFGSFGSNLAQASQIEYITAIFDLYSLYSPALVGAQPAVAVANPAANPTA